MTTVNTFDDILDILDRNPEYQEALRQRVLDEEHRRLPERIDRAVKAVEELAQTVAEFVQRTNETLANHETRLERVEGQIADLNDVTNRVLETLADIQNRLATVEDKVDALADVPERLRNVEDKVDALADVPERLRNVEDKVDALADVPERLRNVEDKVDALADVPERLRKVEDKVDALADVPERLANVETTVDTMQGQMSSMQSQIGTMQGQLNNLNGTDYERRIVRRSRGIVERQLGIRQAQLLQAVTVPDNTTVPNLLRNAVAGGAISGEQEEDVDDADIILFGNTSDGSDSYVVAEVSITIDDHDVDRAYRRAAVLHTASGVPAKAAVIGAQISDANRERAENLNVGVVIAAPRDRG